MGISYDDPGRYTVATNPRRQSGPIHLWIAEHEDQCRTIHHLAFENGILTTCRVVHTMPVFLCPEP